MKALYRDQTYIHGDYATVSLYPVFRTGRRRRARYKPTDEVQQLLNEKNARERLARQLNANFTKGDGFWTLTFAPDKLPQTRAEAIRLYQAWKRRLQRYYARHGLGELKMAAVYHGDAGGKRLHIHAVINADIPAGDMLELWGNGYVAVRPLKFNQFGLYGIAEYMLSGMDWGRAMTTRNLTEPQAVERTGRISKREIQELWENWDSKQAWEGRWPGYKIAKVAPFYNWFNKHFYLRVYLYREANSNELEE